MLRLAQGIQLELSTAVSPRWLAELLQCLAWLLTLGDCPRIRYSNDYLLMGFRKNLNYPDTKLQINQFLHSFFLKLVHIGLIQSIFTYIAGFAVKFSNSGRINPVIMALTIFLKLCAAQTIENSPAIFSLPRTLKPRKPLFFNLTKHRLNNDFTFTVDVFWCLLFHLDIHLLTQRLFVIGVDRPDFPFSRLAAATVQWASGTDFRWALIHTTAVLAFAFHG